MAYSSKVGSFNIDVTKTAGQTQAISGVGFQPKIVLFWWSGSVATGDSVSGGDIAPGFGAAISSSSRFCVTALSRDAQSAGEAFSGNSNSEIMRVWTTVSTYDGILDFSSMDADGFTVVVDDQFANAYRVSYLALGGTDLTNVYIGSKAAPTTTGNFSSTDVGFQADAFIFASADTTLNTATAHAKFSIGMATDSSNQGVVATESYNAAATIDTVGYGYNGEVVARITGPASVLRRDAFVSADATGFTLNHLEGVVAYVIHYIAFKGGQYLVSDLTTRTDGNDIAETVGFTPVALLFASANRALSTQDAATGHNRATIGAATSTSNRACAAWSDEDALADSETAFANYDTAVYAQVVDDATVGLMDIKSIDASGFTAVMDDTDPSACWVTYLAIGATAASGSSYDDNFSLPKQGNLITSLLLTVNESVFLEEKHEASFSDLLVSENSLLLNKGLGINISVESIYSDLISLEKSLNILINETTDYSVAFALNRQLFILSDAIRSLENSISLGKVVDISFISEAVYSTIITLAKQLNIFVSSIQTTEESFVVGKQLNILASADIVHSMALSLAKSLSIGYLAGTNYVDSLSLVNQLNIAIEELKTIESSFSLNRQLSISELVNVIYLTIFSLSKSNNISLSSIATYNTAIALAKVLLFTNIGGADYYDDITLAKQLITILSALQTINENLSLGKQLSITTVANSVYLATVSLAKTLDVSLLSTATYDASISFIRSLAIALVSTVEGGAQTYNEAFTLSKSLEISKSTLLDAIEAIALARSLAISVSASMVANNSFSLGKSLNASLVASLLLDFTLAFIRQESITTSKTLTLEETLGLTEYLDISDSVLATMAEQLNLGKSVGISATAQLIAEDDISLGKILVLQVSGGLAYDEAFILSLVKAISISSLLVTFTGQLPLQLRINDQSVWLITAKDTLVTHSGIIKSDNSQANIIGKDTDHV